MISKEFQELMRVDTIATAKVLLGMQLCLDGQSIGRIVETEAYLGENIAEAVLIRALELPDGTLLANGPGKLTKFVGISKAFDGQNLQESRLQLAADALPLQISSRPRIGVTCVDHWREEPLCFYVAGNRHVSKIAKIGLLPDEETWKKSIDDEC